MSRQQKIEQLESSLKKLTEELASLKSEGKEETQKGEKKNEPIFEDDDDEDSFFDDSFFNSGSLLPFEPSFSFLDDFDFSSHPFFRQRRRFLPSLIHDDDDTRKKEKRRKKKKKESKEEEEVKQNEQEEEEEDEEEPKNYSFSSSYNYSRVKDGEHDVVHEKKTVEDSDRGVFSEREKRWIGDQCVEMKKERKNGEKEPKIKRILRNLDVKDLDSFEKKWDSFLTGKKRKRIENKEEKEELKEIEPPKKKAKK